MNLSGGLSPIAKINNMGCDCFILATLHEIARLPNLHTMLNKSLHKHSGESQAAFEGRSLLQRRLKLIVEPMLLGQHINDEKMIRLREALVQVGFLPPLTLFQRLLLSITSLAARYFPFFFSSQKGDMFGLYNTIRHLLDEKDYYIPTSSLPHSDFYNQIEKMAAQDRPVIHLNVEISSDFEQINQPAIQRVLKDSNFILKVNSHNQKKFEIPSMISLREKQQTLQLSTVQCTKTGFNGSHSFIYIRQNKDWYLVDGNKIKTVSFETVLADAKTEITHLCYIPAQ